MPSQEKRSAVFEYLASSAKSHQRELMDLLRIPSISAKPAHAADVRRAAEWTLARLQRAGLSAELVETEGRPAVIGAGPQQPGRPTVLHYGHYDVQPEGDLALWTTPPFEPAIRHGALFARGAADDKGQMLCAVHAAEAWRQAGGGLPINVKFLIEGEEEIGSPHLATVVEARRKQLACDYVLIHDTAKYSADQPSVTTATKGLVYQEIVLTGPKKDLHSGSYGGQVANPATALAHLLASFHDAQGRINISGFYDDVLPLGADERKQMEALPYDEAQFLNEVGSPTVWGEAGFSTLERRWARPTFEVNGIYGGYAGPGTNTIIPSRAGAKVSMRLVPNQRAASVESAFQAAVRDRCPKSVCLEIISHGSCDPYLANLDSPGMQAAKAAVELGFSKPPVLIREGGTLPILPMFRDLLGADCLMLGYCLPGCNAHSPDEFFHLADFEAGARTTAAFFGLLAECG